MSKGELPLSSLQWTFNPCSEGFHLQGVIRILTLDPQMTSGLEIKIETTEPRTGQIDHRIHLPAEILKTEWFPFTVLQTRLQQRRPGVPQGLQLPIEIAAECLDQQRAQIGC